MCRIFIIAHNIRSLHNVGSIFRTADAFGAEKVFLTGYTGCPPRKEIAKVSLGAEKIVPWEYVKQPALVMKRLRQQEVKIAALEQTRESIPLANFKAPEKIAVILGNEVRGVSSVLCCQADFIVAIPMLGKKESLNVSVACGIVLYTLRFNFCHCEDPAFDAGDEAISWLDQKEIASLRPVVKRSSTTGLRSQ